MENKNILPDDPGYPLYAVEEGTMEIMGHTLRTAVLNNGERVVLAEDAEKFFHAIGMMP